jgi:hypothetical protein
MFVVTWLRTGCWQDRIGREEKEVRLRDNRFERIKKFLRVYIIITMQQER